MGSADEFCKRGIASRHIGKKCLMPWREKSLTGKRLSKGRLLTLIFCCRNLVNFKYYKKAAQLTSAWVILSQVAHVNAIRIFCAYSYWRVGVLLHNSLPAWANWLLIFVTRFYQSREWGMSRSTATHVFFINLNGRIMGRAIDLCLILWLSLEFTKDGY